MPDTKKLAALKGAMLEHADELASTDEHVAAALREVAEDAGMLRRFGELLATHDTAAEAVAGLTATRPAATATTDLSGRGAQGHGGVGRSSFAKTDRVEGENFVD